MSFNDKMHPRNIYRNKPDFKYLASKYERFKKSVKIDDKGKVHMDFKDPSSLRALTWTLLKNDFQLDVDLPDSRLVPTIPLRLNYLLWIEDMFINENSIKGVDIGTGAACVYPLLAAVRNKWRMIGVEADEVNYDYANKNVKNNHLDSHIEVLKVDQDSTIEDILSKKKIEPNDNKELNIQINPSNQSKDDASINNFINYACNDEYLLDFCMCNPPFYGSLTDLWGVANSRSSDRPEKYSVRTASEMEAVYEGGEVEFVNKKIIQPSLQLKHAIRVYTTMLGKKSSLKAIINILKQHQISNISSTEFCQGRTMRWAVAWSFLPTFSFKEAEANKQFHKSTKVLRAKDTQLLEDVQSFVHSFLVNLQLESVREDDEWRVVAKTDTWSHQRRRKRKMMRDKSEGNKKTKNENTETDNTTDLNSNEDIHKTNPIKIDNDFSMKQKNMSESQRSSENIQDNAANDFLLEFDLKIVDSVAEFHFVDGSSKELMHQIYQNFKNKLDAVVNNKNIVS